MDSRYDNTEISSHLRKDIFVLYIHITVHPNRFIFNNQTDALINQMYSVINLYMFSGIFSAHHQDFSTVNSALVSFMQVCDDRLQAE